MICIVNMANNMYNLTFTVGVLKTAYKPLCYNK